MLNLSADLFSTIQVRSFVKRSRHISRALGVGGRAYFGWPGWTTRGAAGMCGSSPRRKSRTPVWCEGRERGGREGRREKEAKKGRWKVSVRNASLLEDNPRAGPVCFKSNQSIRINYPRAPPPPSSHRIR